MGDGWRWPMPAFSRSVYMLEVDSDSRLGRECSGTRALPRRSGSCRRRHSTDGIRWPSSSAQQAGAIRDLQLLPARLSLAIKSALLAARHTCSASTPPPCFRGPGPDFRTWEESVLRSTTTDDLKAYLAGAEPVETTWLTPARQHEEAWFLGLRRTQALI